MHRGAVEHQFGILTILCNVIANNNPFRSKAIDYSEILRPFATETSKAKRAYERKFNQLPEDLRERVKKWEQEIQERGELT
jgi:phosphoglycerate-specific signal transduction histidine kinase